MPRITAHRIDTASIGLHSIGCLTRKNLTGGGGGPDACRERHDSFWEGCRAYWRRHWPPCMNLPCVCIHAGITHGIRTTLAGEQDEFLNCLLLSFFTSLSISLLVLNPPTDWPQRWWCRRGNYFSGGSCFFLCRMCCTDGKYGTSHARTTYATFMRHVRWQRYVWVQVNLEKLECAIDNSVTNGLAPVEKSFEVPYVAYTACLPWGMCVMCTSAGSLIEIHPKPVLSYNMTICIFSEFYSSRGKRSGAWYPRNRQGAWWPCHWPSWSSPLPSSSSFSHNYYNCVCVYIYMYIYMHVYSVCIHLTCMCIYIYICIGIYMYNIHVHIHIHIFLCIYTYKCIYPGLVRPEALPSPPPLLFQTTVTTVCVYMYM